MILRRWEWPAGSIAAGLVLLALGWSHLTAYHAGRRAVQAETAAQAAQDARQALETTIRLATQHDTEISRLRAQIRDAAGARDAALRRLRDLSAADILPGPAAADAAGQRSDDAELFRQAVARALAVGAEADADRAALMECRAAYDAARNR